MKKVTPILLLLLVVADVSLTASRIIRRPPAYGDFGAYLVAARLMAAGENIYDVPTHSVAEGGLFYLYPPLLALLCIPLTMVPVNVAIVLWCLLNVVIVGWIVTSFHASLADGSSRGLSASAYWIVAAASILLAAAFIQHTLDRGQVNLVQLSLAVLGVSLISKTLPRPITGGILIGLSIAIKALTLPVALWYLLRNLRATTGIVLGTIAGLMLPGLFIGLGRNGLLLRAWFENYVFNSAQRESHLPLGYNLSILAQLRRFFTPVNAFAWRDHSYSMMLVQVPLEWLNIVDWIARTTILGTLLYYAIRYRRASETLLNGGLAISFASIPLLFPTAQKHYFVFLLPAYIYAAHAWYCLGVNDRWFRGLVIASFVSASLMTGEVWGKLMADIFTAAGFLLWGTFLLIMAIFRAARCLEGGDFRNEIRPGFR